MTAIRSVTLYCDHEGCGIGYQLFTTTSIAAVRRVAAIRGWVVTEERRDFCPQHARLHSSVDRATAS